MKSKELNSKLLDQGSFGCVYYPGFTCKDKKTNKKIVSKLHENNNNAINEYLNGITIKRKIKGYKRYFAPIISRCNINLTTLKKELLEDCEPIKNYQNNNYVLLNMPYIKNISFGKYIINKDAEEKIVIISKSLIHCLIGIKKLLEIGIVHMDLKDDNILFNLDTGLPVIIDFGISLQIENIPKNLSKFFYVFGPDYYIWCIEIHCINYLVHKSSVFTETAIDEITYTYVEKNSALFHEKIKKTFIDKIRFYLKQFVGKSKKEIIDKCLESIHKWDLYSMSILYIKVLNFLFKNSLLENKWLIEMYSILFNNISPNPDERHTIQETIDLINNLNKKDYELNDMIKVMNHN